VCKRARKFFGEPARRWIAHFRALQSDVESDPQMHSVVSTFEIKQMVITPVTETSCHIVEHLHQGRIVRRRTIDEITGHRHVNGIGEGARLNEGHANRS
jgi:hypothetical protein